MLVLIAQFLTPIFGENAAGVVVFPLLIVFGLIFLWIPSWLFRRA